MLHHDRVADWFREWRTPLRRYLSRRARSSVDIDDIAQEVFLRLLRYEHGELVSNPRAYLYKVAANVCAEWATQSCRREPHSSEWLDDLIDPASLEGKLARTAAAGELKRTLDMLPPRRREILRLHFAEEMAYHAIAKRLKLTPRTVKRDVVRAYAALRELMALDTLRASDLRRALYGSEDSR